MSDVTFQCRMPRYDNDGEWTAICAHDAQRAAEEYSERCDFDSAMRRFEDETALIVIVKQGDGMERRFKVSRELSPDYYADELDPQPVYPKPAYE